MDSPADVSSRSHGSLADRVVTIEAIGTALPPLRLTHTHALEFARQYANLSEGTLAMYARIMAGSEIETRAVAFDDLAEILETDHDRILARFEHWAVELSVQAVERGLESAGVLADEVGFLAVTTCTGYLCPGLSSYVAERCRLRPDVTRVDIVGMGCGAALPAMEQASQYLRSHSGAVAVVVSTEICSAAMFAGDAVDLIISNTIFGDGSAAAVLRGSSRRAGGTNGFECRPRLQTVESLLVPEWRDGLRFRTEKGHLRNVLSRDVPVRAGEACRTIADRLLARHDLRMSEIDHWVIHPGGKAVLDAVQQALELPPTALATARSVMRRCGNMSSPSVLFVLDETHREKHPREGERAVVSSFGAGFAVHAALLEY